MYVYFFIVFIFLLKILKFLTPNEFFFIISLIKKLHLLPEFIYENLCLIENYM